jgi:N-methylhydantoinase A
MHAGVFAFELGVQRVIVPQGNIASTWCGFGAASADILHIIEQVDIMLSPFNAAALNERFDNLRQRVNEQFAEDGVPTDQQQLQISLDMRHKGQINEVEVVVTPPLRDNDLETLHAQFLERYELIYGKGASLPWARLEAVTFRIRAFAKTPKPDLVPQETGGSQVDSVAQVSVRPIYWSEPRQTVETPIYSGARLRSGNQICGPAVIETTDTTLVVHPGRRVDVDTFGNFVLSLS